ncbi:MAG: tRNA dihydrouridine(20/20a) synthase DusA, partial [Variibacter sp.]
EIFGAPAGFAALKPAIEAFFPYVERELSKGTRLHAMTRHMLGLFRGVPGARAFRRHLAIEGIKPGADLNVLIDALALVSEADAAPSDLAA